MNRRDFFKHVMGKGLGRGVSSAKTEAPLENRPPLQEPPMQLPMELQGNQLQKELESLGYDTHVLGVEQQQQILFQIMASRRP